MAITEVTMVDAFEAYCKALADYKKARWLGNQRTIDHCLKELAKAKKVWAEFAPRNAREVKEDDDKCQTARGLG